MLASRSMSLVCPPTVVRRATAAVVFGALSLQTACFSYRPLALSATRPGSDVRITLTTDGSTELEPVLGPKVRSVTGQVQEVLGDTAVVLLADEVTTADGDALPWRRGRITLPQRAVASGELRALDRRKTRTFVVATVVTFVVVIAAALKKSGYSGSSRSGPGSGPPE